MKKNIFSLAGNLFFLSAVFFPVNAQEAPYKNFTTSVYCRVYEVNQMNNPEWLKTNFDFVQKHIHLDKVYLETHRDLIKADAKTIAAAKKFFAGRGIRVSGGITLVRSEVNNFQTFCYSDPAHREEVLSIVRFTAANFDEVILDDFFFTNCKCEKCIQGKGERSWWEFRTKQLGDFSEELVKAAKTVNPKVTMIIKYPNWYEHFHNLGYNLEREPKIFDMIYTGAETRDPDHTQQHLQPYQSYSIMRYFENVSPGKNGGGWVDPYFRQTLDRYGEQLAFTLYSRPKEMMLFCLFDLNKYLNQSLPNGTQKPVSNVLPLAGYTLEKADAVLSQTGKPVGLKCYRPYHSDGEDFLPAYLGMLGIPIEMVPVFPAEANMILLTEDARYDPDILSKIKRQLVEGKSVVITSGFLKAMQGKGIEDIAELRYTANKSLVSQFTDFHNTQQSSSEAFLIPQLRYPTNDTWELVSSFDKRGGFPILMRSNYAKGNLYTLTIPDNPGDLNLIPQSILTSIKKTLMQGMKVITDSPADVCLFAYDNNSFIVHSISPDNLKIEVILDGKVAEIVDIESGEKLPAVQKGKYSLVDVYLLPHTPRAFKFQSNQQD